MRVNQVRGSARNVASVLCVLAALVLSGLGLYAGAAEPDHFFVEYITFAYDDHDGDSSGSRGSVDPITFQGFACVHVDPCPKVLKIGGDGNIIGCQKTSPESTFCLGKCQRCTGGQAAVNLCALSPGHTCSTPTPISSVLCGKVEKFLCRWRSGPPEDFPLVTPNGCYCSGEAEPTLIDCHVAECQM